MHAATQRRTPGRLVTLDPFELATEKNFAAGRALENAPDVGCVDWYLYPVNRKARPTGGSGNVSRGGGAVPSRENRSA